MLFSGLFVTDDRQRSIQASEMRIYWDGGPAKIRRFLEQHSKACLKNKYCIALALDTLDVADDNDDNDDQDTILQSEPPVSPALRTPPVFRGSAPITPPRPKPRPVGRAAYNAGMLLTSRACHDPNHPALKGWPTPPA
jgi:hypothetical protein